MKKPYIPDGCTQQSRVAAGQFAAAPASAEPCTEIGAEAEPAGHPLRSALLSMRHYHAVGRWLRGLLLSCLLAAFLGLVAGLVMGTIAPRL